MISIISTMKGNTLMYYTYFLFIPYTGLSPCSEHSPMITFAYFHDSSIFLNCLCFALPSSVLSNGLSGAGGSKISGGLNCGCS
jgi:hypothetical protein